MNAEKEPGGGRDGVEEGVWKGETANVEKEPGDGKERRDGVEGVCRRGWGTGLPLLRQGRASLHQDWVVQQLEVRCQGRGGKHRRGHG